MDFLERLTKECILFGEQPAGAEGAKVEGDDDDDDDDDDLFGSAPREHIPRISVAELMSVLSDSCSPQICPDPEYSVASHPSAWMRDAEKHPPSP
jgi:hypothetical protein